MLYEALLEKFNPNEPILINDLSFTKLNYNYLRQLLKRLVDDGKLMRYIEGVYYIPKKSSLLGKALLDVNKVIMKKYIRNDKDIYGYYTGLTFANQIGLTTQVPFVKDIATNKESSRSRKVEIKKFPINLKSPRVLINKENYKILQVLDVINEWEKWSEYNTQETFKILNRYIASSNIDSQKLREYLRFYPAKVSKKAIESGLI